MRWGANSSVRVSSSEFRRDPETSILPTNAEPDFPARGGIAYDFLRRNELPRPAPRRPRRPKATMTRRTRGREIALQVLYLLEQNPGVDPAEVERFIERRLREPKLRLFAQALVAGVRAHQPQIDELIAGVAENWRLDRMAAIDRNILRLGAFEILHCPEIPTKVAINEALELAKRYSTAQSSRFVNGILDRLLLANSGNAKDAETVLPDPEIPADEPTPAGPTLDEPS